MTTGRVYCPLCGGTAFPVYRAEARPELGPFGERHVFTGRYRCQNRHLDETFVPNLVDLGMVARQGTTASR
jgi:hypothetical protein